MHPWTRELHRQAMRGLTEAPRLSLPRVPRERRGLAWMTDRQVEALAREIRETGERLGMSRSTRDLLACLEQEVNDRRTEAEAFGGQAKEA